MNYVMARPSDRLLELGWSVAADGGWVCNVDTAALIALATERHCPDCGRKIDRVEAPEGRIGAPDGAVMDGRGMWPVWHHHDTNCPLYFTAGLLGLR